VSVATGTIVFDPEALFEPEPQSRRQTRWDPTIVDGLTSLLDKPAVAAQPGASGQWQMLQPAGPPPAPPEGQESVSASNDLLWIGALRHPRSSSLPRSGGLCPVDSPAGTVQEGPRLSPQRGIVPPSTQRALGSLMQGVTRTERPCPSRSTQRLSTGHGLGAMARAQTPSVAIVLVEQSGKPFCPRTLACLSLRAGEGRLPLVSSRQAITAPGGREPTANENGSQRS
jgi:hypothetical protein